MIKTFKYYLFSSLLLSLFQLPVQAQEQADNRPNIIVILADDLGYADVGFTGCEDIKTPRLDKLAESGIVCNNAYVTHPYCGPSRAGLLTGRYQARFGMDINPTNSPFDLYMGLPLVEKTLGNRLKEVGYQTAIIGKWHMGGSPPYHPNNKGFDHFYGFLSGGHHYFPSSVDATWPLVYEDGTISYIANEGDLRPLWRNNNYGEFNEYLTTALSRDAAQFVNSTDKPFLLYLAYNAPHQPLQAPEETIEKYSHIENKDRQIYAAMVDKMDEGIGMVIDALKEAKKLDNTLIFFLSDNGGIRYKESDHRESFASNYPFKKGKGSMYEGGIHVPFLVHWPNTIKKPGHFDGLVSALDIAATAYAIAGVDASDAKLDGVNLVPYLARKKKDSPHQALYWREGEGRSWAVRTLESKYLFQGERALFDMEKDPYEGNSIIESEPDRRAEMARLWNDWNAQNKPVIWLQAGAYQKKRLEMYEELHKEMLEKAAKRKPVIIE